MSGLSAVLMVGPASCGDGGDGDDGAVESVDVGELAAALLTEADEVEMTSYGTVPMTAEDPGDYYQEPLTEPCDAADDVELVAPNALYAYMGDGGDYLYMDQWLSGETVAEASERFAAGARVLDACVNAGELELVESSHPDVDELRRYERTLDPLAGLDSDGHVMLVYARDGGVILLQSTAVVIGEEYDAEQRDHLADVVVAKLAELGGVEVSSDGS